MGVKKSPSTNCYEFHTSRHFSRVSPASRKVPIRPCIACYHERVNHFQKKCRLHYLLLNALRPEGLKYYYERYVWMYGFYEWRLRQLESLAPWPFIHSHYSIPLLREAIRSINWVANLHSLYRRLNGNLLLSFNLQSMKWFRLKPAIHVFENVPWTAEHVVSSSLLETATPTFKTVGRDDLMHSTNYLNYSNM